MSKWLWGFPLFMALSFHSFAMANRVESSSVDKLLKIYEEKQELADLRLYYMVKTRLKTRNERIFFLNLKLRDKKIYTKYLLKNSDIRFLKTSTNALFF